MNNPTPPLVQSETPRMTYARRTEILSLGYPLTQDEIAAGYHFCYDWDGMFIGPEDGEMECCTCGGGAPHD